MRRRLAAGFALVLVLGGVSACGSVTAIWHSAAAPTPGTSGSPTTPAVKPTATKGPAKTHFAALTCNMIKNATVGSGVVKYNDSDGLPLADGTWSGEDGHTITLTACAVGDLDGDGSVDAMGALKLTAGGTGEFWTVAFWHNFNGSPVFTAVEDLGDRNPVESLDVSAEKATVVWLTRSPGDPLAAVTIRRTQIVSVSGNKVIEVAHMDEPYTP